MKNLTLKQLSISIEYLINPVNTRQKAFLGTCDDIKNYIIVRDNISNESIGSSINSAFKKIMKFILDLISRIKSKILPRIKNTESFSAEDEKIMKPYISKILIPLKDICRRIDKGDISTGDRIKTVNNFIEDQLTAMGFKGDLYELRAAIKRLFDCTYVDYHMGVLKKLKFDDLLHKINNVGNTLSTNDSEKIIAAYDSSFKIIPGDNLGKVNSAFFNESSATAIIIIYQAAGLKIDQIMNYYDEVSRQYSSGEITKFVASYGTNSELCKKCTDILNKLEAASKKLFYHDLDEINLEAKSRIWVLTSILEQLSGGADKCMSIAPLYHDIIKETKVLRNTENKSATNEDL